MGGGGSTNTVQQSDPWAGQQQYLLDVFQNARNIFDQGPIPYFGESAASATPPQAPNRADFTTTTTTAGQPYYGTQPGWPGYGQRTGGGTQSVFDSAGYAAALRDYESQQAPYDAYLQSLADPSTVKTLAPVAPETYQAQDIVRGAIPDLTDLGQSGASAAQFALNDAVDVRNNPYFGAAVDATISPFVTAFTGPGGVLNTIRDQFGTAGQYGGDRQALAIGEASGRLSDSIGDVIAKMGSTAYGQGLDAQSRALALLPSTQQTLLTPATALDAVGTQSRQLEQDYINEAIKRYNAVTQGPAQNLSQFSNFIQGQYGGTATTSVDTPGTSPLNAALGGAALGYSAYAAGMLPAAIGAGAATGIGAVAMLALAAMQ